MVKRFDTAKALAKEDRAAIVQIAREALAAFLTPPQASTEPSEAKTREGP
jgi:hypothetical protein